MAEKPPPSHPQRPRASHICILTSQHPSEAIIGVIRGLATPFLTISVALPRRPQLRGSRLHCVEEEGYNPPAFGEERSQRFQRPRFFAEQRGWKAATLFVSNFAGGTVHFSSLSPPAFDSGFVRPIRRLCTRPPANGAAERGREYLKMRTPLGIDSDELCVCTMFRLIVPVLSPV